MCLLISVFLDIFSFTFTVNPKPQGANFFQTYLRRGGGGGGGGGGCLKEKKHLCEVGEGESESACLI